MKEAFGNIARACANQDGELNLVPNNLASLTDAIWLNNMLTFTTNQIAMFANAGNDGADPDIQF